MASKDPLRGLPEQDFDGTGIKVGIVCARWNPEICGSLLDGAVTTLQSAGAQVTVERVAGAYELPLAASVMLPQFDGVLVIGCLVKGETMHFEYIAEAVTQGVMRLNLDSQKPVIYGVLTVLNTRQAKERSGLDGGENSGIEWAKTLMESCRHCQKYKSGRNSPSSAAASKDRTC
ncbi:unnamed protein product [Amoebophrya sp. A120]|nr:unnamed protein product [Amoebophrya sp. A120]|eukprot:GSA120T00020814001.1